MTKPLLADAFGHHAWASLRLIDACAALGPEQLQTTVPGTYGSIIDTLRHLVEADRSYLNVTGGGQLPRVNAEQMDLGSLRSTMQSNAAGWSALVAGELDPELPLIRRRDDGSTITAPLGIRLAQALHHGTDHRSQVCTALTSLAIEPPDIDVWSFAQLDGRAVETPAST
jgi:uncharacterized damage-inducible protein DinB